MCDRIQGCGCRVVVVRTYRELRARNIPSRWAFDTAARIFRLHHPDIPDHEARRTVSRWCGAGG